MRLNWLHIPRYQNLRDFRVDFDEGQSTTVLLGRNGSGKSYLIEAIVEIFRELEAGMPPHFSYTLQYVCHDHTIKVDADPNRASRRLEIEVDDKSIPLTTFQEECEFYLPKYVFGYYSGWSSRLERQFDKPTRRFYDKILKSNDGEMPLRRLFFCRKEYSQLVLLAFFLSESSRAHELLKQYLGIEQFDSALFVLKTPYWGSTKPNRTRRYEGDPRFWFARGAFRTFLDRLWIHALAPIRNTEAVERDVRRQGERTERLYLFIKNETELASLKYDQEDSKTLFGYLESLFLCDLIDEVRVTVKKTDGTRIKFNSLSEGEQQLLTVLGLLLFTQDDESLYLLDEPDTHLNPLWTYDFLELLQDNIRAEKGQLLIATHNPLMIGSLHKNQVRIFTQEEERTVAPEPEYDPIGIGIEGLLKSEIYGLRSSLAPEVLDYIDKQNELLALPSRDAEQERELEDATQRLQEIGINRSHPNPLFDLFSKAIANEPLFQKPELSREEIEEQNKLASEILEEILEEEAS